MKCYICQHITVTTCKTESDSNLISKEFFTNYNAYSVKKRIILRFEAENNLLFESKQTIVLKDHYKMFSYPFPLS